MAEKLRAAMGEVIDAAAVIHPSGAGDIGGEANNAAVMLGVDDLAAEEAAGHRGSWPAGPGGIGVGRVEREEAVSKIDTFRATKCILSLSHYS